MADSRIRLFVDQSAHPVWALDLDGEVNGEPGSFAQSGTFGIAKILVHVEGAGDRLEAILPSPIEMPLWLVHADGTRFKTVEEIKKDLDDNPTIAVRLAAVRDEATRRLATQEIAWSVGTFFQLPRWYDADANIGVDLRGEAKLTLASLLVPPAVGAPAASPVIAEFAVRASVTVAGGFKRTFALVVILQPSVVPALRFDLDDFNIALPPFRFPNLTLSSAVDLDLLSAVPKLPALERLVAGISVTSSGTTTGTKLKIDASATPITWGVFDATGPARLSVTANYKGTKVVEVEGLSVTGSGGQIAITADRIVGVPINLGSDQTRFGPLVVRWEGVTVTPTAELPSGPANDLALRALIEFDRLLIYPADDPEAVIAIRGKLVITPSAVAVESLELVEPYPIKLALATLDAAGRAAARIVRFLADLIPDTVPANGTAPDLAKLLDVLGRIAAAVARAAVFTAEDVANVFADALAGLARILGTLLQALAQAAGKAGKHVCVEVRIATDPFEIRQIYVTLRTPTVVGTSKFSVIGIDVEIHEGWQPGLLIDFVAAPGAYLVATRSVINTDPDPSRATEFATVSTDLWLTRPSDKVTQATRDADDKSGDRGQRGPDKKPLLQVQAKWKDGAPQAIVIAGLSRGRGVFLQRVKTPPTLVTFGAGQNHVVVIGGVFAYEPLAANEGSPFALAVEFEKDRVLPLLGMGEAGRQEKPNGGPAPGFAEKLRQSLSQVVWVKRSNPPEVHGRDAIATVVLGVKAGGLETEIPLSLRLSLDTFEVSLKSDENTFPLVSRRIEERALGLVWVVEQVDKAALAADTPVPMFKMGFRGPESFFELDKQHARMELRFSDASSDGRGVIFDVSTFAIGRTGLDLEATVKDNPVRLNGLDVPFRFNSGGLTITGSRITKATIAGRGVLPPQLAGDAECSVVLVFAQDDSGTLVLQSGKVELDKKGDPIVCHSTRFTLTITNLDLSFVRDGGYHFYFLVTGSLQFTPKPGEFESGLLQFFKDVRIDLDKVPLTGDARVLARHLSFQVPIKPKKRFPLFSLFTFELRGIGFHPSAPQFDGAPAMNVSGQIAFTEIGDVMQPKIDFHGLWIAPPKEGQALPRIRAEGLTVDIGLSGTAKLRGSVVAVDERIPTIEGTEFVPPGYKTYGFLGEGQLAIEGWATMSASMGFLEVERPNQPGERRRAFFLYAQVEKVAYEIPTPIWTFYLREVGFGFGFRYTLEGIKAAEKATSTAKLIQALDDTSKRQGDLARFSAWRPDVESDNVTLALRGAVQMYPAEKSWNQKAEETADNPFFFDLIAALRSDMTFLMSARGWLAVNYNDFITDADGLRSQPGFRGYLFISAPRSEILARVVGDSQGYVGKRLGLPPQLREALKSVDWSATLYIRPGLLHFELGWPNQLIARLKEEPTFRVVARGGMIFRVAEDGLLWGFNIEADAFLAFSGSTGGGSVGVAVEATLTAKLLARLIAYISWRLQGTLVYGLISLDASLAFSVRAWMDIDLGFTSITIRIGFSFSVQFSAIVEIAISTEGVGAQVQARVGISVFGCTLSVGVGFSINNQKLEEARARVDRFLAMGLTAETPDPARALASDAKDARLDAAATQAIAPHQAPLPEPLPAQPEDPEAPPPPKPPVRRAYLGTSPIGTTDFWLVLHRADAFPHVIEHDEPFTGEDPADYAYALLVPREPDRVDQAAFYSSPVDRADETTSWWHRFSVDPMVTDVWRWLASPQTGRDEFRRFAANPDANVRWDAPIPAETTTGAPATSSLTLAHLFDECFLYNAKWETKDRRVTEKWAEPPPRQHATATRIATEGDTARNSERDRHQRDRAASATRHGTAIEGVYQARSTVLTQFIDQFTTLARTGDRAAKSDADVTDLGLVFFGKRTDLEKLNGSMVQKRDADAPGRISIFNPPDRWFGTQDPALAEPRHAIEPDGIKLDWDLEIRFPAEATLSRAQADPEQYLHHYEIVSEVEGRNGKRDFLVKPASTIGETKDGTEARVGTVTLIKPDWQFSDNLSDLPERLRKALLPAAGDANELEAAAAWAEEIGGADEVTITYSVTPVDIAGTRGLPRGFVVDVPRPQPPLRPAHAELRIIVRYPASPAATDNSLNDYTMRDVPPSNLAVVLALDDAAWEGDDPHAIPNGTFEAWRYYRLVLDPEDVVPSGSYGSDAITERLRAPQSTAGGVPPTGDEIHYTFSRRGSEPGILSRLTRTKLEVDERTREQFSDWLLLAGGFAGDTAQPLDGTFIEQRPDPEPGKVTSPKMFEALWSRREDGKITGRVATRFALETIVRLVPRKPDHNGEQHPIGSPDKDPNAIDIVSRRVPVQIEILVETKKDAHDEYESPPVTLRPDSFEWPTRLAFPPLLPGAVRTQSGFTLFRAPAAEATLTQVVQPASGGVVNLRDPERRILTQIEWDAAPTWPELQADPTHIVQKLHGATIAGFDVHELDIDDLAPSDTTGAPLAADAIAWTRPTRVARVQLLRDSDAMLVPYDTEDRQGWTAHYPSETWRVRRRDAAANTRPLDNKPVRKPWWSAREATLGWPKPVVRRRPLPAIDENLLATLLSKGAPDTLRIAIQWSPKPDLAAKLNGISIVPTLVDFRIPNNPAIGIVGHFTPKTDPTDSRWIVVTKVGGKALSASELRALLLCIGWTASAGDPPGADADKRIRAAIQAIDEAFAADPSQLDDFSLVIAAKRTVEIAFPTIQTRTVDLIETTVAISFRAALHAVLEETLAGLSLDVLTIRGDARGVPVIYSRFVPIVQPARAIEEGDLPGLLAATAAERDPYGWGVLQSLGLAASLRLFDADADEFLHPAPLLTRIDAVTREVLERYKEVADVIGVPFVDVMLRPGKDRVPGPFDATKPDDTGTVHLDEDALAFAQVSLRPAPVRAWYYARVAMRWRQQYDPSVDTTRPTAVSDHAAGIYGPEAGVDGRTFLRFAFGINLPPAEAATLRRVPLEVFRLADQRLARSDEETPSSLVAALRNPTRGSEPNRPDPDLTLILRRQASGAKLDTDPFTDLTIEKFLTLKVIERVTVVEMDGAEPKETKPGSGVYTVIATTEVVRDVDLRTFVEVLALPGVLPLPKEIVSIESPASPDAASAGDAFERFPLQSAGEWANTFRGVVETKTTDTEDVVDASPTKVAFDTLKHLLLRAAPKLVWPDTKEKVRDVASGYLTWSQRFLDHGAAPVARAPGTLRVAFAAPHKQTPWRLAAAPDGTVSLSFLHSDRWGHVRAYAVKPIGRYQDLVVGAHVISRQMNETLVTTDILKSPNASPPDGKLVRPIGHAVAVSPRTERIETPVILGSARKTRATDDAWEVVVARHGEESIAYSNRTLFARLGFEGTALGFVREYGEPRWPERLNTIVPDEQKATPECYPRKEPALPALPSQASGVVTGDVLGAIAYDYPTLWKGADIYRFRKLPYFYRATVLATARAGIVVSPIATAVQEDFPRTLPANLNFTVLPDIVAKPQMKIVREPDNDDALIRFTLPLLGHADLLDAETLRTWVTTLVDDRRFKRADNVAWWPDPGVVYTVLRQTTREAASLLEEEDAEIRLVPRNPAGNVADVEPIVVRTRGPVFVPRHGETPTAPGVTPGEPKIDVKIASDGSGRRFALTFDLTHRREARNVSWQPLPHPHWWDDPHWTGLHDLEAIIDMQSLPAPTTPIQRRQDAVWLAIANTRTLSIRIVKPAAAPWVPDEVFDRISSYKPWVGLRSAGLDRAYARVNELRNGNNWNVGDDGVIQDGPDVVFEKTYEIPYGVPWPGDSPPGKTHVGLAGPSASPKIALPASALARRDLPLFLAWALANATHEVKARVAAFVDELVRLSRLRRTHPYGVAVETAVLDETHAGTIGDRRAFNTAAHRYASITAIWDLTIDCEHGTTVAEAWQNVQALADQVDGIVDAIETANDAAAWSTLGFAESLAALASRLRDVQQTDANTPEGIVTAAGLPAPFTVHWPEHVDLPDALAHIPAPSTFVKRDDAKQIYRFLLLDMPADVEIDASVTAFPKYAPTIKRLARRLLLEAASAVRVRAIRSGAPQAEDCEIDRPEWATA